jgi:hypothetical protein
MKGQVEQGRPTVEGGKHHDNVYLDSLATFMIPLMLLVPLCA